MSVDVKINDHSKEVIEAKDKAVAKALEMMGLQCETYAKMMCPVDTGMLRNSLTHDVRMSEEAVYIGTNVEYAPYVELGHKQTPGRYVPAIEKRLVRDFVPGKPYLRPAVENHVAEYKKIAEECLKGY